MSERRKVKGCVTTDEVVQHLQWVSVSVAGEVVSEEGTLECVDTEVE